MSEFEPDDGERVDVGSLLSIDVESELRKLTDAQIQGSWELPAELVRNAVRRGAKFVRVEIDRHGVRVADDGGPITPASLQRLRALLDADENMDTRHRALADLEGSGDLALLAIVGLHPTDLQIRTVEGCELLWAKGTAYVRKGAAESENQVAIRGARMDRGRAREWLTRVARFAAISLEIDGAKFVMGLHDAIASIPLAPVGHEIDGRIFVPMNGDTAKLWLLRDGLVSAHVTLPDTPCFEAAVELGRCFAGSPAPTAERMRDEVRRFIDPIIDRAVEGLVELGRRGSSLPAAERTRVTQLLLRAARDRRRAPAIAQVPLFRGLEADGRERYFDLLTLRQSMIDDGGERHVLAVLPDQPISTFAAGYRLFVLDEVERSLLSEIFELRFRTPPRRATDGGFSGLRRALAEGAFLKGGDFLSTLRDFFVPSGRAIEEEELEPRESILAGALRAQLDTHEVAFCEGAGPIRRRARRLVLPRDNPTVRASVELVASDPAWVYPVILALLDGREFPDRARRRWGMDVWIERE